MTRLAAHQLPAARLRDLLRSGGLDDLPDAELLQRYARYGEHPAFDVLLRRHGPLVLGVCRRILAHSADAEDAFQATFLVLVRKARTIARGERIGPWLYGVAVRVALKTRARRARLGERLEGSTDMIPDPTSPNETPDWLPVLDLELQALPAKYREPIILCELRGASRSEAARSLGIPEGYEVVDGRLKLALGTSGKRLARPLELDLRSNVFFYDVKATKESLSEMERSLPIALDAATPLPIPGSELAHPLPGTRETLPLQDPLPLADNRLPYPLPAKPKAPEGL